MSQSAFPMGETTPDSDRGSACLSIEDAGDVIEALATETARGILTALHEEPLPASDLAERADTSLQNTTYHLEKLQAAGLVEVVDTWYSSRGGEMDVYAPVSASVLLCLGPPEAATATGLFQAQKH